MFKMFKPRPLVLSEIELQILWRESFSASQQYTLNNTTKMTDAVIAMTLDHGKTVNDLLSYLDDALFPGIYRKTVEQCLDQYVYPLIPDEETITVLINSVSKFGVANNYLFREQYIAIKISDIDPKEPQRLEAAIRAYIYFGLGDYKNALDKSKELALSSFKPMELERHIIIRMLIAINVMQQAA